MPIPLPPTKRRAGEQFVVRIDPDSLVDGPDRVREAIHGIGDTASSLSIALPEIPESVRLSKTANYNDDTVSGRSEPWKTYTSSAPTMIEFSWKFMAEGGSKELGVGDVANQLAGFGLGLVGRFVSGSAPFLGVAGNSVSTTIRSAQALASDQSVESVLGRAIFGHDIGDLSFPIFKEIHEKLAWMEALTYPQYDDQGRAYPPPVCWIQFGANFDRRVVVRTVSFDYKGPWEVNTLLCYLVEVSLVCEEVNRIPKGFNEARKASRPPGTVGSPFTPEKLGKTALELARNTTGI
jgi:hypothetical protein